MTIKPLTTCPSCGSALILPCGIEEFGDAHVLVDRRCPDCELRDRVLTNTGTLAAWERAHARRLVALAADLMVLELEAWLRLRAPLAPEAP
jgi:hypothetical protein